MTTILTLCLEIEMSSIIKIPYEDQKNRKSRA